jgi:ankyrin repeat protein
MNNNQNCNTMNDSLLTVKTKLIRLLLKQKWGKARRFLKTKVGLQQARQTDGYGVCALSIALVNTPPVDVVKILLEIEPTFSLKVDRCGMIPLHMACRCGASYAVIKTLLEHDKGASAQVVDLQKKSPLHYSAKYVCDPLELERSVCSKRDTSAGSESTWLGKTHRASSAKNSAKVSLKNSGLKNSGKLSVISDCTVMSMPPDEFQDQLQAIQEIISIAPEIVMCADIHGDTPIDILQDCKADHPKGPKWERADIVCEVLRAVSLQVYRELKTKYEQNGSASGDLSDSGGVPNAVGSSHSSSSSKISLVEFDSMSCSQMDLSAFS